MSIIRYFLPICGLTVCAVLLGACDRPETVVATDEPDASNSAIGDPPLPGIGAGPIPFGATITVEGVRIDIPDRWVASTVSSTFTAVQYTIPGDARNQDATITISNPIGGGLMYNILRWERQFRGDAARTETSVVLMNDQQMLEFIGSGPFDTGLPGSTGLQDGMMVLGAVPIVHESDRIDPSLFEDTSRVLIEIDQAATPVRMSNIFIKLTGPEATVEAARDEWDAMLRSIRIRDVSSWTTP